MKTQLLIFALLAGLMTFSLGCNPEREVVKPQTQAAGGGGGGVNEATRMTITRIEVLKFPEKAWDNFTFEGADIYCEVETHLGSTIFSSSKYEDVTPSQLPKGWNCSIPITFSLVSDNWKIRLYDYDFLSVDDYMGGFLFDPRGLKLTKLTSFDLGSSSTDYHFRLTASYQ